jgi:dihydrofolate reductase
MRVILLAAIANNGVIGYKNSLPWNYPEDLANFKALTSGEGKILLMGRKTYDSLPVGKVSGKKLVGRKMVVVTQTYKPAEADTMYIFDIENTIKHFQSVPYNKEMYVVGGSAMYDHFLKNDLATDLMLTEVNISCKGDTYFPKYNKALWTEVERKPLNKDCEFVHYKLISEVGSAKLKLSV